MKKLMTCLGALALSFATANAHAIPLLDLSGGLSLQVGDKLFDGWEVLNNLRCPVDGCIEGGVDTSLIDVTGVGDGTVGNEYGLSFSNEGAWSAEDDLYLDLFFGFSVTVLDPAKSITGVTLNGVGQFEGDSYLAIVEKDVFNFDSGAQLAFIDIYADAFDLPAVFDANANFAAQSKLWVEDNIFVDGLGGSAQWTTVEQRFIQTEAVIQVPAPTTLALLALGLLAAGYARRNARRAH